MTNSVEQSEQLPQFEIFFVRPKKKWWYISYLYTHLLTSLYVSVPWDEEPSKEKIKEVLAFMANIYNSPGIIWNAENISLEYFARWLDDEYKNLIQSTQGKVSEAIRPHWRWRKITF